MVSSNSGGCWTEDFLEFKIMDHMSKALFPEQAVDCYICLKTYARPTQVRSPVNLHALCQSEEKK